MSLFLLYFQQEQECKDSENPETDLLQWLKRKKTQNFRKKRENCTVISYGDHRASGQIATNWRAIADDSSQWCHGASFSLGPGKQHSRPDPVASDHSPAKLCCSAPAVQRADPECRHWLAWRRNGLSPQTLDLLVRMTKERMLFPRASTRAALPISADGHILRRHGGARATALTLSHVNTVQKNN